MNIYIYIYIYIYIWEVIKKCRKYRAGDRDCMLCVEEKLAIASCKSRDMLNQRF